MPPAELQSEDCFESLLVGRLCLLLTTCTKTRNCTLEKTDRTLKAFLHAAYADDTTELV